MSRPNAHRGDVLSRRHVIASPWLHLALIFCVAAFFRLWQIGEIPPGLFGDEAADGLDALDVLAGRGAVFFPANYGREGLHMWIVAVAFRILGVTPLALRLPSAIAGIVTALATYWLGRELGRGGEAERGSAGARETALRSARTLSHPITQPPHLPVSQSVDLPIYRSVLPLLAALYVATSYWHVHFSRFGIRGVFTPLCGALAFAAFWRGVNQQNRPDDRSAHSAARFALSPYVWFAFAGLFLGLALHFYTASRFFPFFLIGFLILDWLARWATGRPREAIVRRNPGGIAVMFVVAALVFAPLAGYFIRHPGSFTQRAVEVAATRSSEPLARVAQAALANVAQFFVPGAGDPEQFYNLPRRAVFDLPTAFLAVIGMAAALRRWRTPPALFLLTWFAALLLPSFLATDRWPTLPRVLGVIPAVYFFPAIGALLVVGALLKALRRACGSRYSPAAPVYLSAGLLISLLLLHAGVAYRDYFRIWGPAQATFDAFEGDMTAAWQWLRNNEPQGHVYLSADIYRHPTFMLLYEHATVQTIFTHRNAGLSWFDGRGALPLAEQPAVYLIGSSAEVHPRGADLLRSSTRARDRVSAPDGSAALTVVEAAGGADLAGQAVAFFRSEIRFTDHLTLIGGRFAAYQDGVNWLTLAWRTDGPDPQAWPAYRLEVAGTRPNGDPWQDDLPFDAFRPPEWTPGGRFLTWHKLDVPGGEPLHDVRLRLLRTGDRQPVTQPDAADGWHRLTVE